MGDNDTIKSSDQIKKNVGKIILQLNNDILELQNERIADTAAIGLKQNIESCQQVLVKSLLSLKEKPGFITNYQLGKLASLIETNIETIQTVLRDGGVKEVNKKDIEKSKEEASRTIREGVTAEVILENEIPLLIAKMVKSYDDKKTAFQEIALNKARETEEEDIDTAIEAELDGIDKYKSDRVKKMRKEIKEKMTYHKNDLLAKWSAQKEVLDYQASKEFRTDFEMTHRALRNMVNDWDRRKISDLLSDHLMDIIDKHFDEYMVEFRRMDEEKRMEAAYIRKRNVEIEEYRKEKRRNIPTWPKSMSYTKFKPDLLSWDKEHHLTSGSVKFGLLAEMLKCQDRITTYEQIQTRLGKERNDINIITKVVELLDGINEETVYNKLASAWEQILSIKRKKEESLNDFFSRFETLLYSLNLADDKYQDLEPMKEGRDLKYYKERENMMQNKVEMNDKLKAVHLLRALDIEESIRRDIISKVDFSKQPKDVFETVKTAIRDICGDGQTIKPEHQVMMMKPWQGDSQGGLKNSNHNEFRGRSYNRRSGRSSSGGEFRGERRRSQGRDRSRDGSKDRSWSRGRRNNKVDFKPRRDPTPGPGRSVLCVTLPMTEFIKQIRFSRPKIIQVRSLLLTVVALDHLWEGQSIKC